MPPALGPPRAGPTRRSRRVSFPVLRLHTPQLVDATIDIAGGTWLRATEHRTPTHDRGPTSTQCVLERFGDQALHRTALFGRARFHAAEQVGGQLQGRLSHVAILPY